MSIINIACNDALYYEFKKVWENIIVFINHIHGQNKEVCLVAKVKQVKKVVKLQIPGCDFILSDLISISIFFQFLGDYQQSRYFRPNLSSFLIYFYIS